MTILLGSTSDLVRVTTDAAVTVDVHAVWADLTATTAVVTPGRSNTAISTATTTTVVASPVSGTVRKVKSLHVRNKHASLPVTVTISHTDGTTVIEIDKRVLGPGSSIYIGEDGAVIPLASGGIYYPAWATQVIGAYGDCDPGHLMRHVQRAGNIAATPTNFTDSVARCCTFVPPQDITINRIRYYGVGTIAGLVFRVAIYRMSDLARLTAELPYTTTQYAWGSAGSALGLSLQKDTVYFMATAVNTTGTVAGPVCVGTTVAATTGLVYTDPTGLPGSLISSSAYLNGYNFQFAVTTGALPDPANSLRKQAVWTGGVPAYWLDTVDT